MPILTQMDALCFIAWLIDSGPPIMMLALFLTAFPPVFGYSSLITMSGKLHLSLFRLCAMSATLVSPRL